MNKNNRSALVISILIPLAIGSLSTVISKNRSMYFSINRPALSPPAFIFPVVWTILYVFMGISSYIIYESKSPDKSNALRTYAVQLFFNFFWSIIFFGLSQYLFAFFLAIGLNHPYCRYDLSVLPDQPCCCLFTNTLYCLVHICGISKFYDIYYE